MDNLMLGKLLMSGGFIASLEELDQIEKERNTKEEAFLTTLIRTKKISPTNIANYLAVKMNLSFCDLDFVEESNILLLGNEKFIEKFKILPIKKSNGSLSLLLSDPTLSQNDFKFQFAVTSVTYVIVEHDKLILFLDKLNKNNTSNFVEEFENSNSDILLESGEEEESTKPVISEPEVEDAPVVKFLQQVLLEAVKQKASDVHLEPYEKFYRIRFRIDGILYEKYKPPLILKDKIASRIKVISKLDISEKRVPQDGKMKLVLSKDRSIDFRVSTLPTLYGEKIVMRILDSSAANLNIEKLGYGDAEKKRLLDAVQRPYGMVLVTGPTGSGKTVSLYSCLTLLNKDGVNIATAEDPAEINLPGINQVTMNEKAGLTFPAALKSFLRQDPDIIMVGEIRDLETADISIKAAQTGHLVLSTLHTNDAPTTLTRLMNMGVAPFNIASSVILITAQRLARKLCECKVKETIPVEALAQAGFEPSVLQEYEKTWFTYKPVGCDKCGDKGYSGRVGIYQVMPISEEIQEIILKNGTALDIAASAKRDGILSLREAGLIKVKDGITSLEEIEGVTNI